jgi:dTDP-4-dehydrorhamnose 3,5-epimerase
MVIPSGVFHAHLNVGETDALLVSMPTRAYDYADPDVYRLPLDTDLIPYSFDESIGW